MTKILDEVLAAANAKYAENFGDKGTLPLPPSRHFAILTCMDARLDPSKYAGLAEGDAHVIRNAGGRASDDAIRSLVAMLERIERHGGSLLMLAVTASDGMSFKSLIRHVSKSSLDYPNI
jgi:hypothetical protein